MSFSMSTPLAVILYSTQRSDYYPQSIVHCNVASMYMIIRSWTSLCHFKWVYIIKMYYSCSIFHLSHFIRFLKNSFQTLWTKHDYSRLLFLSLPFADFICIFFHLSCYFNTSYIFPQIMHIHCFVNLIITIVRFYPHCLWYYRFYRRYNRYHDRYRDRHSTATATAISTTTVAAAAVTVTATVVATVTTLSSLPSFTMTITNNKSITMLLMLFVTVIKLIIRSIDEYYHHDEWHC